MAFLLDMTMEDMQQAMKDFGQPAFRGKQLFEWVHKGKDFAEMTNLSKALQTQLQDNYRINPVQIQNRLISVDKTRKYLYLLPDSNIIEGVVMRYHYGNSICVSSQVGCKMGCVFCASGEGGFIRNLTAGEMVGQVLAANEDLPDGRISHIVVMGSGEPLDNYDELMKFIRLVNHPSGLQIGARNITVSTCGLPDQIMRLAEENLQINLALSLHAPNDEVRQQLLPIARKYSIKEVLKAVKEYIRATGRRVTIEYTMVEGVNDSLSHAVQLYRLLAGIICHVNLIPLNQALPGYAAANKENIQQFYTYLQEKGVAVTIRRELGADIQGACGQLRRNYLAAEQENK